jgi:hypothetical protein
MSKAVKTFLKTGKHVLSQENMSRDKKENMSLDRKTCLKTAKHVLRQENMS